MVTEEQSQMQIDFLDNPPSEDVPAQDAPDADTPVAAQAEGPPPTGGPSATGEAQEAAPPVEPVAPAAPSSAEMQVLRQQAAEYEEVRMRASLQQEGNKVQRDLEAQGFLPEHAQQTAQQHIQSRQAQAGLIRRGNEYGQEIAAKQVAAEQIAQKFRLSIADLPILKQADSPEIMEGLAKNISERRGLEEELSRLRQGQVPAQQYDNSQGSPDVAANDSNLLDRYNAGDRSPNATAAAKKAAGLG